MAGRGDLFAVRAMNAGGGGGPFATYGLIVVGIVAHFVWETLVSFLASGSGTWPAGSLNPVIWVVRVLIALIAAGFSFTGIWNQVQKIDVPVRYFTIFTLGFAVDALSGPVVSAVAK